MKRAVLACLLLVALTAIRGFAAEPATESKAGPKGKASPKAAADKPEPVIPQRKLTFDISEEERPMPFDVADPELFEHRYMATFQLVGPRRLRVVAIGPLASEAITGYSAATERHRDLLFGGLKPNPVMFKSVLSEMPQERLPSEEVVSLLTKRGYPYFQRAVSRSDPEVKDKYTIHFRILASTPERAKALAQGVLSVYDHGVFYPLQKEALAVKEAYEKRLPGVRESLKKALDEMTTLEKALEGLKEYEDITKEALVNFTTQLRLITVDLVGIEARIDACNKILADRKSLSASRIDQVETVKITAEIELVGLAARKKAIEEIVKKGRQRKELSQKFAQAGSRVGSLQRQISQISGGITHYEAELKKCVPYPVEDGNVVIRRIKWVPPEKMPPNKQG